MFATKLLNKTITKGNDLMVEKCAQANASVEECFLIPDKVFPVTRLHDTNEMPKRRERIRRSRSILRTSSAECPEEGFESIEAAVVLVPPQ